MNVDDFKVDVYYQGQTVDVEKIHDETLITSKSLVTVEDLKNHMKTKLIKLVKEQEKLNDC